MDTILDSTITDEQKRKLITQQGLNPDEYDVVFRTPEEYAAIHNPQPKVEPPVMGGSAAMWDRFKRAIVPSAVAIPGMIAGGELGGSVGSLLGPIGTGVGGIVGSVAGGMGLGSLASMAQEKILKSTMSPESYQAGLKNYQQAGIEHPILSTIADQGLNPLVFGPGGIKSAITGVGKLAYPSRYIGSELFGNAAPTISAAEKAAMFNTAVNSAIGGGGEAIKQAMDEKGQPFDKIRIALSTLLGAAQSKPWGLGTRVPGLRGIEPQSQNVVTSPETIEAPAIEPKFDALNTEYEKVLQAHRNALMLKEEAQDNAVSKAQEKLSAKLTADEEKAKAAEYLKRPYPDIPVEEQQPILGKEPITPAEQPIISNQHIEQLDPEQVESKIFPQPQKSLPTLKDLQSPQDNIAIFKAEESDVLPKYKGKVKEYNPNEPFYQPTREVNELANTEDRQRAIDLATKRGVAMSEIPEIRNTTQELQRGESIPSQRSASISDIATRDTGYHEIVGHQHIEDLLNSTNPADKKFAEYAVAEAGGDKEKLAQLIGERAVRLQDKPLRSYAQDVWSNTKKTFGGGDNTDTVNLAARRGISDRPYSESPELQASHESAKAGNVGETFNQPSNVQQNLKDKEQTHTKGISIFEPLLDKMEQKGDSNAVAAKVLKNFEVQNNRNNGIITTKALQAVAPIKGKLASEKAARYIYEMATENGKHTVNISPQDKAIIDGPLHDVYKKVQEESIRQGLKIVERDPVSGKIINVRDPEQNPNRRWGLMTNAETLKIITRLPESDPRFIAKRNEFEQHQLKYNTEFVKDKTQAREAFNTYLRGVMEAAKGGKQTPDFNAIRKSEGYGIPWSWMEKDINRLVQRYGSNASRDLAFFQHIQDNPEARAVLNIPDQLGNKPNVEGVTPANDAGVSTMMRRVAGSHTFTETQSNAIEHFVRSVLLGPVTGIKNLTNTFQQTLPYLKTTDIPKMVSAFGYIKQGLSDGFAKGVIRPSTLSTEIGNIGEGVGVMADKLKQWGDTIRYYTGANALEQISRAHTMALGEMLARANWGRALSGDITARRFIKQFMPEVKDFGSIKSLTEDMVKETAANFVERVQGTYGGRGLPVFLLEPSSPFYWMMSLNKWSVEKMNVVKSDVLDPAIKEGDFGPLLRYSLGALATGQLIRTISETLFNKKQSTPNLTELQNKGKASDWAYKATELMALSSYGGIFSDAVKLAADKAKGYNNSKSLNIPSLEVTKNISSSIANASAAIASGEYPIDVSLQLLNDIIIQNVQALRVAYNQTLGRDTLARQDKFRDMKVYNKLEGKDVGQSPDNVNMYQNLNERQFKQADDVKKAEEIYNKKIAPKMEQLTEDDRKDKLHALRENNYQTMPSDWQHSEEYYNYLVRTQGKAKADTIKQDFERQRQVNREKNWIVPRR